MIFFSVYLEAKIRLFIFLRLMRKILFPTQEIQHSLQRHRKHICYIYTRKGIFVSRGQLFSHMISQIILKRGNGNNSRKALSFANISRTKLRCLLPVYPGKSLYDRFQPRPVGQKMCWESKASVVRNFGRAAERGRGRKDCILRRRSKI